MNTDGLAFVVSATVAAESLPGESSTVADSQQGLMRTENMQRLTAKLKRSRKKVTVRREPSRLAGGLGIVQQELRSWPTLWSRPNRHRAIEFHLDRRIVVTGTRKSRQRAPKEHRVLRRPHDSALCTSHDRNHSRDVREPRFGLNRHEKSPGNFDDDVGPVC